MTALPVRCPNAAHDLHLTAEERVGDRGLSHARRADKRRGTSRRKVRIKWCEVTERADGDNIDQRHSGADPSHHALVSGHASALFKTMTAAAPLSQTMVM